MFIGIRGNIFERGITLSVAKKSDRVAKAKKRKIFFKKRGEKHLKYTFALGLDFGAKKDRLLLGDRCKR